MCKIIAMRQIASTCYANTLIENMNAHIMIKWFNYHIYDLKKGVLCLMFS